MKLSVAKGATSVLVRLFIQDSSSTTGAGLTGLVFNTSGLVCYRARDDDGNAGGTAITLATATLGTWASGGFKEKDATNMPGWYEFGIPNAALASGSRAVSLHFKGATNMAPLAVEIELTGWDNQDSVHGGMSALPNTACTTNASLITSGTGTAQLSVTSGRIDIGKALGTAVTLDSNNVLNVSTKYLSGTLQTGRDIGASVLLSTGTGTGQLDFTSGVVKANVTQLLGTAWLTPGTAGTPDVNVKLWNALTTVALPLVPTVAGRTLDVSTGGEAGLDWANIGSPTTTVNLSGTTIATTQKVDVDTIKTNPVVNAGTITFPSGATLASTSNITAAAGVALTSSYDFAKGTVAVTESYNADGSAPTPIQALLVIMQMLTEMSKSGSTITVKKLDGSTTAFTLTLDDATTPASITRTG